ncbi:MAG: hypothetical protein RJA49_1785 [Actinomycetota bacterium]
MTFIRRDVWSLGTAAKPWDPITLGYAHAVRAMQQLPLSDPRSWSYQAAIHGLFGTPPPPGAPWNQCQHSTWFFLPWHRSYLYQFERIVRSFAVAAGGPADWALPYWNYDAAGKNALPRVFRATTLPDGTPNPLFVPQRSGGTGPGSINGGATIPGSVTSSFAAMAATKFTTPTAGVPVGFGGPKTGFAHFGPAPGLLENQPHNIIHVVVGGNGGLMTDPDTAALDPIFWLHHANIDRLWETWRLQPNANPATLQFKRRSFRLRNDAGKAVRMKVGEVLDAKNQLDYTYDSLPHAAGAAPAAAADAGEPVTAPRKPAMVGRTAGPVALSVDGAQATVPVGAIPGRRSRGAAAAVAPATQFHLELADIEADANPGVVFGVYVNLPAKPTPKDLDAHRVGLVSLFGVEHSSASRSTAPQTLRYVFDITEHVRGGNTDVHVALLPIEGVAKPAKGAAATPTVRVGTIAVHAS